MSMTYVSGSAFRPTGKGGGSKKGKPQQEWPVFLRMVAEGIARRHIGSLEGWKVKRDCPEEWQEMLETELPGLGAWCATHRHPTQTPWWELLWNRAYKQAGYDGTSARGNGHDPGTRDGPSREMWDKHVPLDHFFRTFHDLIVRGRGPFHHAEWAKYTLVVFPRVRTARVRRTAAKRKVVRTPAKRRVA